MTATGSTNPSYARSPEVRFDAISEGWSLFQQQMAPWIISTLIVGVIYIGVDFVFSLITNLVLAPVLGAGHHAGVGGLGILFAGLGAMTLVRVAINSVLIGLFSGALFRMATKQVRGEAISINDIFGIADVAGPLIVGAIVVGVIQFVGTCLCIIPGMIAAGVLMLTYPLIVDKRMTGVEAVSQSWNALKPHLLMATLFYFVLSLLVGIGSLITCGIGALFLVPLAILSVTVIYRDFFMAGAYPEQAIIPGPYGGMPPAPPVG